MKKSRMHKYQELRAKIALDNLQIVQNLRNYVNLFSYYEANRIKNLPCPGRRGKINDEKDL